MPRQQTALFRALVTLSTIVVGLVLLLPATGKAVDETETTIVHLVQSGDTVWEIARRVAPPGSDIRDTVGEIRKLNSLVDSIIHPGDTLVLPAPTGG